MARRRSIAEAAGADVATRIDWIETDLAAWTKVDTNTSLAASSELSSTVRLFTMACFAVPAACSWIAEVRRAAPPDGS
jgi:hypothetical protein